MRTGLAGIVTAMAGLLLTSVHGAESERTGSGDGRHLAPAPQSVAVTLYQGGFALVDQRHRLELTGNAQRFRFAELPRTLRPATVAIDAPTGLSAHAMVYEGRALTPQRLLQTWVGREVVLVPKAGTGGAQRRGRLLSAEANRPVVAVDERLEIGGDDAPWRVVLPMMDSTPVAPGTLDVTLGGESSGPQTVGLTYMADALGWSADYRLELDGQAASLEGWATIDNDSGTSFRDAALTLVAGSVRDTETPPVALRMDQSRQLAAEAPMAPEAVGGAWHAYSIPEPLGLAAGRSTRLTLLKREGLAVERRYRVAGYGATRAGGGEPVPVPVAMRLTVRTGDNAAVPLPGGVVRVIETGAKLRPLFLGADRIAHTPAGEPFKLELGNAFDITAQRLQTDYRQLDRQRFEVTWRIAVNNTGDDEARVEVIERLPGDWELVEGGEDGWSRLSADAMARTVTLAPGAETTLSYRARISR